MSGKHFVPDGFPAYGAGGLNGLLPVYEYERPAVVLSAIGARCGKCFFVEGRWASLANTQIILPDLSRVDTRFLWHQLDDENRWPRSGTGQPFIKPSDVKAHDVWLPALDEQRRIAAILDQADALRTSRREAIVRLDLLASAVFAETLMSDDASVPTVALGSIANFYAGASLPGGTTFASQTGGNLLMKVSDMNLLGNERTITRARLWSARSGPRSATAPAGSVVIPKRGASIATNKKRMTTRPTVLDPNLMAIQPHPRRLDPRYLFAWFEQFDLAAITSGSSVPQLNKRDLAPLQVPVPAIEKQEQFGEQMATLDGLRDSAIAHLDEIDALFGSLRARAFKGEL